MFQTDDRLLSIADPVDANTGAYAGLLDNSGVGFGVGRPLADGLAAARAAAPVIVPVAKGGRSAVEWNDRNASNPFDTTTYYGATLTPLLKRQDLKAVTVFLGTNDALDANMPEDVTANLKDIVNNLRTDLGQGTLPFVLVGLHAHSAAIETEFSVSSAAWSSIDTAIATAASELSNCSFINASSYSGITGDEEHISALGYLSLGADIAAAIDGVL